MPINVSLCVRFTFVLLSWRFCGGVAAAAPENKNPPVRIASGGCVVSDVKGGVGGSRFGCRYLYVRIPIPEGGRHRFCIVPSVAEGLLVVVFFPNETRISLCGPLFCGGPCLVCSSSPLCGPSLLSRPLFRVRPSPLRGRR